VARGNTFAARKALFGGHGSSRMLIAGKRLNDRFEQVMARLAERLIACPGKPAPARRLVGSGRRCLFGMISGGLVSAA